MANLKLLSNKIKFPERATIHSAGHDIFAHDDIIINGGETVEINIPISVEFNEKERIFLFLRSSIGIKKNCRFTDEKGNIIPYVQVESSQQLNVSIKNIGREKVTLEKDSHYCQIVIAKSDNQNKEFFLEKVEKVSKDIKVTPMFFKKGNNNVQTLYLETGVKLAPEEALLIASGYKAKIDTNTFLAGFVPINEERFIFSNGVAIGDADYYNNPDNEGLYFFKIENTLNEELFLESGTPIVDLISVEFLALENEKFAPIKTRSGGIGSTN